VVKGSITVLGSYAFYNCTALKEVELTNQLVIIKDSVFEGCSALTELTIPTELVFFSNHVFDGCTGLKKVFVSDLGQWCALSFGFNGNPLLTGADLYANGSKVTDAVIPAGITKINSRVFEGYKALTSVTFHDSVTSIGYEAFYGCTGLKSVTVPDSVTTFGESVFSGNEGIIMYCNAGSAAEEYALANGRQPSVKETATRFGLAESETVFVMGSSKMPLSLYGGTEFKDGKERSLIETLPALDDQEEWLDKLLLRGAIEALPERERKIIVLRYFRDMTQSEVAEKIGVSQVQVSRIESKIIKEFRQKLSG
jgi:RNA polymerase sigma factor (sigma-70 family)